MMTLLPGKVIESLRKELPEKLKLKQKFVAMGFKDHVALYGVYKNLAYVDLAMDNIPIAHLNYRQAIQFLLDTKKPLNELLPSEFNDPTFGLIYALYFGLPLKDCAVYFRKMISVTEEKKDIQLKTITVGSFINIINLLNLSFLVKDQDRIVYYLCIIFNQTNKYSNLTIDEINRQEHEKIALLYARATGLMVKGLIEDQMIIVKQGLKMWTDIAEKFVKNTDDPESIAIRPLIMIYDQAKSKWPDFYFNTFFIPKSILEKGYWNQIKRGA